MIVFIHDDVLHIPCNLLSDCLLTTSHKMGEGGKKGDENLKFNLQDIFKKGTTSGNNTRFKKK